jgi:hypothetical protein
MISHTLVPSRLAFLELYKKKNLFGWTRELYLSYLNTRARLRSLDQGTEEINKAHTSIARVGKRSYG